MATYAVCVDNPVVKGNNLAIIVYEKKQFPFTFQGLPEALTPVREYSTNTETKKDEDIIDLLSEEEDRQETKPTKDYVTPFSAEGWLEKTSQDTKKHMMDDGSGGIMSEETRKHPMKRLFVTKTNQDAERSGSRGKLKKLKPVQTKTQRSSHLHRFDNTDGELKGLNFGLFENRELLPASGRDAKNCKGKRDCAGVISLAEAEVIDWMAVSQKVELRDRATCKLPKEENAKRMITVEHSHSSAKAKKSLLPPLGREETEENLQADLSSREINQNKPRMRGVLKITGVIRPQSASRFSIKKELPDVIRMETVSCDVSPKVIEKIKDKAREKATEKVGFSQNQEVHSLRADRHFERYEESEERKIVLQTLERFEVLRREVLREEEVRVKESLNAVKRPDLKAGSIMKSNGQWLNETKTLGALPGVEVGDQFYFRIELCIIGLHRQIQAGIDSIHPKDNQWDVPLAASIIASGGYEDDLDDGETLIYTGQGGNNYQGDKRQQQDQKLERGNLALKNSYNVGVAVRVIRGSKCKDSPSGKIYTYDGLYKVEKFWLDKGLSGYGIYKFQLQRLPGQSQTSSAIVRFMGTLKSKSSSKESIVIDKDISRGKESLKVFVVNAVDMSPELPAAFKYTTNIVLPDEFQERLAALEGCGCIAGCSDTAICSCIRRNGGKLPYTCDGTLINVKDILYECSPQCQCPPTCCNRVSQNGTKYRLEVFKKEGGWGLRSWDYIPPGGFVCEYTGQVVASAKPQNCVERCNFVLHLNSLKQRGHEAVNDYAFQSEVAQDPVNEEVEDLNFLIDARECGNVGRFINHSETPNLYVQFVLYDHGNLKLPHVMLFAMENLRPFTELTFDYGKNVIQVSGADET